MPLALSYAPEFKRDYKKLSVPLRLRLKERGKLFEANPFHSLLKTHKLSGALQDVWAFSVDVRTRVLFQFVGNGEVLLLRVGDHSIYRKR